MGESGLPSNQQTGLRGGYVGLVTPARVRGCAPESVPVVGAAREQADASRRQSGPRKATLCRSITVRFRSKSCLDSAYICAELWEKGSSRVIPARVRRDPQQANVGSKTRSADRVSRNSLMSDAFHTMQEDTQKFRANEDRTRQEGESHMNVD
jgi:hypothetical protein